MYSFIVVFIKRNIKSSLFTSENIVKLKLFLTMTTNVKVREGRMVKSVRIKKYFFHIRSTPFKCYFYTVKNSIK